MNLKTATVNSGAGPLELWVHEDALVGLAFRDRSAPVRKALVRRFGEFREERAADPGGAVSALERYFAGELHALDELRVDPGGTSFQREVWSALRRIPPGDTATYGSIAAEIGRPSSVRAVGAANGDNPVSLVIPCHRVIGKDGSLTGYAGGLPRKAWLLAHEGGVPRVAGAASRGVTATAPDSALRAVR